MLSRPIKKSVSMHFNLSNVIVKHNNHSIGNYVFFRFILKKNLGGHVYIEIVTNWNIQY